MRLSGRHYFGKPAFGHAGGSGAVSWHSAAFAFAGRMSATPFIEEILKGQSNDRSEIHPARRSRWQSTAS